MKTMGFSRLMVVTPRLPDYREHPEAVALATGGNDVLAASESHATLSKALEGVTTAYAMTGYDRQFGPPMVDVRSAALQTAQALNCARGGRRCIRVRHRARWAAQRRRRAVPVLLRNSCERRVFVA